MEKKNKDRIIIKKPPKMPVAYYQRKFNESERRRVKEMLLRDQATETGDVQGAKFHEHRAVMAAQKCEWAMLQIKVLTNLLREVEEDKRKYGAWVEGSG